MTRTAADLGVRPFRTAAGRPRRWILRAGSRSIAACVIAGVLVFVLCLGGGQGLDPAPTGRDAPAGGAAGTGTTASGITSAEWNASGWYQVGAASTTGPVPDSWLLCYDPALQGDLYFGGYDSVLDIANETWLYNATGWHELALSQEPSQGAVFGGMAWDAHDDEVVLYGGSWEEPLNTTWVFSQDQWTELEPAHSPPALTGETMFSDPASGSVILFGGEGALSTLNQTWEFVGGDWSELNESRAPSPRTGAAATWDPSVGAAILFGGETIPGGTARFANDTWEFANGTWSELTPSAQPAVRAWAGEAYDPSLGAVALFGGWEGSPTAEVDGTDLWAFTNGNWARFVSERLSPPADETLGLAEAPDRIGLVLFQLPKEYNYESADNETWEFSTLSVGIGAAPDPAEGVAPVRFNVSTSGALGPEQFAWSFGDGENGSGAVVNASFPGPGSYTVSVVDVDAQGRQALASRTITVFPPLTVSATVSPRAGPAPLHVGCLAFPAGGDPPYRSLWTGAGAPVGAGDAANLTLAAPGNYSFEVTVTDAANYSAAHSVNVTVETPATPAPLQVAIAANATAGPAPLAVSLRAESSGGTAPYTDTWSLGANQTTTGPSTDVRFPEVGTFSVGLEVVDGTGTVGSAEVSITVTPAFSVVATVDPAPAAGAVAFNASASDGSPPYTFYWAWGDGSASSGPYATHSFATSGTYQVRTTAIDALGRIATAETTVTVRVPTATGSVAPATSPTSPGPSGAWLSELTAAAAGAVGGGGVLALRNRLVARRDPARGRGPGERPARPASRGEGARR